MTGDPVLREAQHAEAHSEPSDEDLERIARMPRSVSPSDLEPNPSVSVGYPNRGLLRFGMRIGTFASRSAHKTRVTARASSFG
jgi:hypothetical protein